MTSPTQELTRIGQRAKRLVVVESLCTPLSLGIIGLTVLITLDGIFRLPVLFRLAELVAALVALIWVTRSTLGRLMQIRVDAVDVAMRLESLHPRLRGTLASAVDFTRSGESTTNPLAAMTVRDAEKLLSGSWAPVHTDKSVLLRRLGLCASAIALLTAMAAAWPGFATVGMRRTLLPLGGARWPARTHLSSKVSVQSAASGGAFALGAILERGDPVTEKVVVSLRTHTAAGPGAWLDLPLAHQGGQEFERLIEAPKAGDSLEFQFRSYDSQTEPQLVAFVDPPRLAAATLKVDPPRYATDFVASTVTELGSGTNASPRAPSMVAGSSAELILKFEADETTARLEQSTPPIVSCEWEPPLRGTEISAPHSKPDGTVAISWTARESGSLRVDLADTLGVKNSEEIMFRFRVEEDRGPEVFLVSPTTDETVLLTATIPLESAASDDLGVRRLWIEGRRLPTNAVGAAGAGATPAIEPVVVAEVKSGERRLTSEMELSKFGTGAVTGTLVDGDVLELRAGAEDHLELAGGGHRSAHSTIRRLRIVTKDAFVDELRGALSAMRQSAIRVDERQRSTMGGASESAAERLQGEISERLGSLLASINSLDERQRRNGLHLESLSSLLMQARDLLASAGVASGDARTGLSQIKQATDEELEQLLPTINTNQERVRDELEGLVALLDRDEDSWVATRKIERIAEELRAAGSERESLSRQFAGVDPSSLAPEVQAAVERLAKRLEETSADAESLPDELRASADRSKNADPLRSEGLERAASRASDAGLASMIREAAQAARANQMAEAQTATEASEAVLEQMISDLKDQEANRLQTLQRKLASMVESLKAIKATGIVLRNRILSTTPVAESMQLCARLCLNISLVNEEALSLGQDGSAIARATKRAVSDSVKTATLLAAAQAGPEQELEAGKALAIESLDLTLVAIDDALEAAQKREQQLKQQDSERRLQELAKQFQQLAERQESVVAGIDKVSRSGKQSQRKTLLESRRLGIVQEEIRVEVGRLTREREEVSGSKVLLSTQAKVDRAMSDAAAAFREGELAQAQPPATRAMQLLRSVAAALEGMAKNDPFQREQPDSGGGGGGAAGGEDDGKPSVPPLAELRVVRALQQDLYERTVGGEVGVSLAEEQQLLQQMTNELKEKIEDGSGQGARASQPAPEGEPALPQPSPNGFGWIATARPSAFWQLKQQGDTLPGLDDVLGTEGDAAAKAEAERQARENLTRDLAEMNDASQLTQLADLMGRSGVLLSRGDRGIGVQRVQEDALKRLDALIDSAQRRSQQQQAGGASGSGEQGQEKPEADQSQGQNNKESAAGNRSKESQGSKGDGQEQGTPPPQDAASGKALDESQVEWGNLPRRERELVIQGLRERMSTVYRRATESYFRKMAKGGGQ